MKPFADLLSEFLDARKQAIKAEKQHRKTSRYPMDIDDYNRHNEAQDKLKALADELNQRIDGRTNYE